VPYVCSTAAGRLADDRYPAPSGGARRTRDGGEVVGIGPAGIGTTAHKPSYDARIIPGIVTMKRKETETAKIHNMSWGEMNRDRHVAGSLMYELSESCAVTSPEEQE
jgi:hypothetical protein